MLQIPCPYCRELRSEEEFSCAGEADRRRPQHPAALSDKAWGDYLHLRRNPRGLHRELWFHAAGCRRYFNVERDTVSYAIRKVFAMGETDEAP